MKSEMTFPSPLKPPRCATVMCHEMQAVHIISGYMRSCTWTTPEGHSVGEESRKHTKSAKKNQIAVYHQGLSVYHS